MKATFIAALLLTAAPLALSAAHAAAQQDPTERARVEALTRRLNGAPPAPLATPPAVSPPAPPARPQSTAQSAAAARQDPAERARVEELTRRLNGAPAASEPARLSPSPAAAAAPQARPQTAPQGQPQGQERQTPPPQPGSRTQSAPRTAPFPAADEAPISARRPPVASSAPAPRSVPVPAPSTAAPRPAAPSAPSPQGLNAAERAALPFRVDLPAGFDLVEGRASPGARVFSVRKSGKTYLMVYAGPSSQFPIYDGQQVTAGGRISVVTTEGARRIAMEHLFQRSAEPAEIHIWLMGLDGAERDEAERIAQTVDPK